MTDWKKWLVVVPARLDSTRLPRKPLADLNGRPLIVRVGERLKPLQDKGVRIVVATDHEDIVQACAKAGFTAQLTGNHSTGTSRVAEVADRHDCPYIMNVQGDEPFVDAGDLITLMQAMEQTKAPMCTLYYRNNNQDEFMSPHMVKVVQDLKGNALYFSRSPLPYYRTRPFTGFLQHMGVYAFTHETLKRFSQLPPTELEQIESLEQLRALENGIAIHLVEAMHPSFGIDTPEDLRKARAQI